MDSENKMTRRQMVAGLGTTLAATAAAPALGAIKNEPMEDTKLEDPTSKYPKPPFVEQSQEWPGLAGTMNPDRIMEKQATRVQEG